MAKILIVDDRAPNREYLASLLGYQGHRLFQAADGAQALAVARAEKPDAVITDVVMPAMDGYELVKRLRAETALAETVVIFHTAHFRGGDAEKRAKECGVQFILPKPCEPELVLRILEQALGVATRPPAPKTQFDSDHLQLITTKLAETVNGLNRAQLMAKLAHVITGPDGSFEIWSETLPQLTGLDPAQIPVSTRQWLHLLHPEDRPIFRAKSIEAGAAHERREVEYRLRRADGAWVHVRQTMEPLDSDADSQGRWFNTLQDVTQHKRAEQQLRAMTRRLVTLQEKERRDIARELHDRVGQNLAALSVNLARLRDEAPSGNERDERIAECASIVEATGLVIQDVLTELKPPMLADYGLRDAVRWHARDFSRRTGITVDVQGDEGVPRLQADVEMALFRIAQAALNNVAQHARAKNVSISLQHAGGRIGFEIKDDGVGFDSEKALASGRWGLTAMRERAEAIDGTLRIESSAGGGTRVIVEMDAA